MTRGWQGHQIFMAEKQRAPYRPVFSPNGYARSTERRVLIYLFMRNLMTFANTKILKMHLSTSCLSICNVSVELAGFVGTFLVDVF